MPQSSFLVLIETGGNQAFLFATNRLKENVGASELTSRAGTDYVREARAALGLADEQVIVSTSGKAILQVPSEEVGKKLIRAVTLRAAKEAPGLDVRGAVVPQRGKLHDAIAEAHQRREELGASVPGPRERFLRLPFVEDCHTSGLPAAGFAKDGDDLFAVSAVTLAKRDAAKKGWERIRGDIKVSDDKRLALGLDDLDKMDLDWHAVLHADANGFGKVFLDFHKHLPGGEGGYSDADYAQKMKRFSDGLDECTKGAFGDALNQMVPLWQHDKRERRQKFLPVVPLVLGGDDLTVVCDGRYAVRLARDFLRAFEARAAKLHREIGFDKANPPPKFTSCAGVAIVKPHYPFFSAYRLAEQLLKSAKEVKTRAAGCSALDFHVLYDASGSELRDIRAKLTTDGGASLTARPYVVSEGDAVSPWAKRRHIDDLEAKVEALRATDPDDPGRRLLPRSTLHDLRQGLFLGTAAAEARLALARGRHGKALDGVATGGKLFLDDGGKPTTDYLDALELVDFWPSDKETPR